MLYALVAIMGLGLIDSYFLSQLGTTELAAIGFIVPITQIVTSFGLGLGMAISSLTSKLIGANRLGEAARLITNGFYLTAILSLISMAVLFWQMDAIFMLIGAKQAIMPTINEYMYLWVIAVPGVMFTMVCSSTFRAIGDTSTSAKIAISMTLANLILDPLLIFGLGPFPEMGMLGASLATVIAVIISTLLGVYQLAFKEKLLLLITPKWNAFKSNIQELLSIAIPAVLANSIVPITASALTRVVSILGTDAVAGYGVGTRIEAVALMVVYALSSTLPMFIGQNLGAQRKDRVAQAIRIAFRFIMLFQFALYVLLALSAGLIASLFSDDAVVQETIKLYLWIVPLFYGLSGIVILINVSVNVFGKPSIALYINIARLVFFYVPFSYLGIQWYGLTGFFIGIGLAHCSAYVLASIMLKRVLTELSIENAPPSKANA